MKPLLVSFSDTEGGAARAALRLHRALKAGGCASRMLVARASSGLDGIVRPPTTLGRLRARLAPELDALALGVHRRRDPKAVFSAGLLRGPLPGAVAGLGADVVHLHWVGGGLLAPGDLARFSPKLPIVWTFHDMWALTGGCHYTLGCERHLVGCGQCPQLGSRSGFDVSRCGWRARRRALRAQRPVVVTPSRWLAAETRRSPLWAEARVEVIPNALDLEAYRPRDRALARSLLGLSPEGRLALYLAMHAASDPRKGYVHLERAFASLHARGVEVTGLVVGAHAPPTGETGRTRFLGPLSDDLTLALAYAAADVVVVPSTQDNLPNVACEAHACGRPVVAFEIGGLPDIVEHDVTGYLARPFEAEDLARGIEVCLSERGRGLGEAARARAELLFAPAEIARRHLELYRSLLPASALACTKESSAPVSEIAKSL